MIPPTPQLALGTATLGLEGSRDDAFRLLDAFADLGGTIIDTAAVYSDWVPGETRRSEGIIGDWLRRRRRDTDMFVCTKGGHPPLGDMSISRVDAASITQDVEASLQRLGVERLDLFFLHRDDRSRTVESILGVLGRLVESGKIGAVGLSNWTAERVALARRSAIVPIVSNQVLGNVLSNHMAAPADPSIVRLDGATLRDAEATGSSLFLFSSQAGGYVSRRLASSEAGRPSEYGNAAATEAARQVAEAASHLDVDPTNLSVSFLMAFSSSIFPVVGPRTVPKRTSVSEQSDRTMLPYARAGHK